MELWVVQLAVALGASRVVGVDHPDKLELLRSVSVAEVVGYTREDPTRLHRPVDVVIHVVGTRTLHEWRQVLAPEGTFVLVAHDRFGEGMNRWTGSIGAVLRNSLLAPFHHHLPGMRRSMPGAERLAHLARLLAAGAVRPVVDRVFPLEQTADALRSLTSGRAVGRVVLFP